MLISFLNALLPLPNGEPILEIEYLNNELLPDIPQLKNTIVDIRCIDSRGRQFLVEMQLLWTDSFESRILYNACKTFSQQISKGNQYDMLAPVYSLNIINQPYSLQSEVWYHHYRLSHQALSGHFIEGIQFILVELPNFIPATVGEQKLTVLWLRFLKEIKNRTTMIPDALMEVPEIVEAVEALKETSYSTKELEQYEKYWDIVRTQKAFVQDAMKKGKLEEKLVIGLNLKTRGFSPDEIHQITGLSLEEISLL